MRLRDTSVPVYCTQVEMSSKCPCWEHQRRRRQRVPWDVTNRSSIDEFTPTVPGIPSALSYITLLVTKFVADPVYIASLAPTVHRGWWRGPLLLVVVPLIVAVHPLPVGDRPAKENFLSIRWSPEYIWQHWPSKHHIIVKINVLICYARDAVEVGLDRWRAEGGRES